LLAFTPGAKVKVELDRAGFDRRYDHASLHTSQHLLSALLETHLKLPTLSWSLTAYPSPCYVEIPRGMTVEEISMIQEEANRLVIEGRKIHVEVEELDPRSKKPVEKLESGRAIGRGLPDDYTVSWDHLHEVDLTECFLGRSQ
jgi:misacylated tRNA(Ala) deacylase